MRVRRLSSPRSTPSLSPGERLAIKNLPSSFDQSGVLVITEWIKCSRNQPSFALVAALYSKTIHTIMLFVDRNEFLPGAKPLRTNEANCVLLSPSPSFQPRMRIEPHECLNHPGHTYWTYDLEVVVDGSFNLSEQQCDGIRAEATTVADSIYQTQYWDFGDEQIRPIRQTPPPTQSPAEPVQILGKRNPWSSAGTHIGPALPKRPRKTLAPRKRRITEGRQHGRPEETDPDGMDLDTDTDPAPQPPPPQEESSDKEAADRVDMLVKAVVEGGRKFQEDPGRRESWMQDLIAVPARCTNAYTRETTFHERARAAGMHQWWTDLLRGCASLIDMKPSGTERGRSRGRSGDNSAGGSELPSDNNKNKIYRLRVAARLVMALINALVEHVGCCAYNIIPALSGEFLVHAVYSYVR